MTRVAQALERLHALYPRLIDLSLDRLRRLLAQMDHPEWRLPPVIHVAGTNGKGSTCAFVRAVAEHAGLRVHVYTSPHLVRFNERIRVAGTLVTDDALGRRSRYSRPSPLPPSPNLLRRRLMSVSLRSVSAAAVTQPMSSRPPHAPSPPFPSIIATCLATRCR